MMIMTTEPNFSKKSNGEKHEVKLTKEINITFQINWMSTMHLSTPYPGAVQVELRC